MPLPRLRLRRSRRPALRTLEQRRSRAVFLVGGLAGFLFTASLAFGVLSFTSGLAVEREHRSERTRIVGVVVDPASGSASTSSAPVRPTPFAGARATVGPVPLVRFRDPSGRESVRPLRPSQVSVDVPSAGLATLWLDPSGEMVGPPRSRFTTVVESGIRTLLLLALSYGVVRLALRFADRLVLVLAARGLARDWEQLSSDWAQSSPRR